MSKLYTAAVITVIAMLVLMALVPYLFYILLIILTAIIIAHHIRIKDKKTDYEKYMQSPQWQAKRLKVLKRDNYKCQHCNCVVTHYTAHVHHLSYKYFGNEPLRHLVTLCRECHRKEHNYKF